MLQPKRTKFRKQHKLRNRGLSHTGSDVSFGTFGLKSVERGRMTARQIEAARRRRLLEMAAENSSRHEKNNPFSLSNNQIIDRLPESKAKKLVEELNA